MAKFIRSIRYAPYQAGCDEVMEMLGVVGGKLPDAGIPPQMIQGIEVWVEPKTNKPNFIRTMAKCPDCGRAMAASRLHQHICKVA